MTTTIRERILSAVTEHDLTTVDLTNTIRGKGQIAGDLFALRDEGIIGQRGSPPRWYARRCEPGTEARHCHVHGCETHTTVVAS